MEHVFVTNFQQQEVFWVVGLRWYAVVEADAHTQAQRIVQQRGAQSWVLAGSSMCAVGLSKQRVSRKERSCLVAGAAFFAQRHARQTVAAIIKLPTGGFWFVAAHRGQVLVRGDHCFEQLGQAQEFMASVLADYPQMQALNKEGSFLEWAYLTQGGEPAQATLVAARLRPRQRRLRPWMLGLVVLFCALGGYYQWLWQGALRSSVAVTAEQFEEPLDRIPMISARALLAPVLSHFYALPVHRDGWALTHSQCDYVLAAGGWQCQAQYQRQASGGSAEHFLQQQQWEEYARALDLQTVQIDFPLHAVDVQKQHEPTPPTLFQLLSQLQNIQPAFSALHYRHRQEGLRQWQHRTPIRLQGPLRSVPLVFDLAAHVLWYRIELRVHQPKQPDLAASQFEVLLEGAVDDKTIH